MKHILLAVALLFGSQAFAGASKVVINEMQVFTDKYSQGSFDGINQDGYTSKKIAGFNWPKAMRTRLDEINQDRTAIWADFVMNSGEYDHVDNKQDLIENPGEEWGGSAFPLRLEGQFMIYKDGKRIGYVVDFSDMVDSKVIQDGSGWVFYVDLDGNLLLVDDWQS